LLSSSLICLGVNISRETILSVKNRIPGISYEKLQRLWVILAFCRGFTL
jgi:hypothetical protein